MQSLKVLSLQQLVARSIVQNSNNSQAFKSINDFIENRLKNIDAVALNKLNQNIYNSALLDYKLTPGALDAILLESIPKSCAQSDKIEQKENIKKVLEATEVQPVPILVKMNRRLLLLALLQTKKLRHILSLRHRVTLCNDQALNDISWKCQCDAWDASWRHKLKRLAYPVIGTSVAFIVGTCAGLLSGIVKSLGTTITNTLYDPIKKTITESSLPRAVALPLLSPFYVTKITLGLALDKAPSTVVFISCAGLGAFLSHQATNGVSKIHHQDNSKASSFYSKLRYKILGQAIPFTICFFKMRRTINLPNITPLFKKLFNLFHK